MCHILTLRVAVATASSCTAVVLPILNQNICLARLVVRVAVVPVSVLK